MKKTKKALASLAIASMALTTVPFNVFAAGTVPTRLAGTTAAQTAVQIADQTGWTGTAILASSASYGMVDALTAGPLASYLKAPILLTGAGSTLDADTKAELTKLAVKTVYVTSGTAVISQGVLNELTGMGITVVPLGGIDRAATSVNIAKKMTGVTKVAVANGLQDALSIAAVASAANEPILLTDKNALPASVADYLAANSGITSSDVIGGTGIISDAVKAMLPGATRHAGMSAYDTNSQVIQDFASALEFGNVYVASGVTGIDALAGAPLAAQTKSPIVLTDGTVPAVAAFVHGKLSDSSVVTALGGAAVVSEAVRTGVVTGQVNPPSGALSVTSVSAASASDFKVVFNQAPADTSKVAFTVSQGTLPVTVSATWNTAKTEATLSKSSNFVQGDYTVKVVNGTTDLGTSTVTISEQKVAKIEITSSKLGVVNASGSEANNDYVPQKGYATYAIYDQYGVDITNTALGLNVRFQTGVGEIEWKDGLLTVTASTGLNLLTFSGGITITANDTSTGVSATATLAATSQIGTLSDITLTKLTNVDGKVLTAGSSSDEFYIEYVAKDISGNPTNNYTLMKQGLILTGDDHDMLTVSSPYVTAQLVEDPADSAKALIKVKSDERSITIDMPLVITAMTWTGKTSQISTTLKKQATVDSFTLYAPSEPIASTEKKVIPFVAYDQNGVAVTKFTDIIGDPLSPNVTLDGATIEEGIDGNAVIKNKAETVPSGVTSVPHVVSAVTKSGKYSTITLNIQKAAVADKLYLDSSVFVTAMQANGATQTADFGYDAGGLSVKDQYGRVIDMTTANDADTVNYYVKVSTTGSSIVLNGDTTLTSGKKQVEIASGDEGSQTVKFELFNAGSAHPTVPIDTKSVTFSSIKDDDIKDYTINTFANPLYIINDMGNSPAVTDQEKEFKAKIKVYGKTASGGKVMLKDTPIIGATSTSADFLVYQGLSVINGVAQAPYAYDGVRVIANKLADPAKTESSANIIVSIMGADNKAHVLTTALKGSTTKPAVTDLDVYAATEVPGISRDDDTITLTAADFEAGETYATILGDTLAAYNYSVGEVNVNPAGAEGTQNVYFKPVDTYGTNGSWLSQIVITKSVIHAGSTFAVSPTGMISGVAQANDEYTISGISTTGLVKTFKLVFK
jgi:putative cell wall-binding protein